MHTTAAAAVENEHPLAISIPSASSYSLLLLNAPPSLPPHQKPILTPKKLSGKQEGEGWLRPRVRGEGHQIMRGGTGGGAKKTIGGRAFDAAAPLEAPSPLLP